MEFTLLAAVAISVGCMYAVLRWEAGRTNAADCTSRIWDGLLTAAVAGMIVGRLVSMVRAGINPIVNPADFLIVRGGVDTVAASAAALAVFAWIARADLRSMVDAAAPAAVAGIAGWHGACVVRDACLGVRSDLPWAISGEAGAPRHPVEIYAALLLAAGTILLLVVKRNRVPAGIVGLGAVALVAAARAVTEPMRLGIGSDLRWWYATAAAVTASATAVLLARHRSGRPGPI